MKTRGDTRLASGWGAGAFPLLGAIALAAVGCQSERPDGTASPGAIAAATVSAPPPGAKSPAAVSQGAAIQGVITPAAVSQLGDPTATELTIKEPPPTANVASLASSVGTGAASNSAVAPGGHGTSHTTPSAGAPNVAAPKRRGSAPNGSVPTGSSPVAASPAANTNHSARPAAALIASAAVTGEGYRTYLQVASPVVLGSEATVTVHLEPQAPFKSNDKYPYRFTLSSAHGANAPATAVTSAQVSPTRTTLQFPVTAKQVGRASISGTFAFSVCTAEQCLVERAPLVLGFEVVADAVSASPNP